LASQIKIPFFSIVIPLYSQGNTVSRAVSSILNQTKGDFEVIVVNDGSTDNGSSKVNQINDGRVRLITQINQGVSVARNRGIHESRGNFVAFLDADDEWEPTFLETVSDLRELFPQAKAYGTAYKIQVSTRGKRIQRYYGIPSSPWVGILDNYFRTAVINPPFCSSSIMIEKSVFNEIGGFPAGVKRGEDLDMWLRIALSYPIAFSTSPQAVIYQEGGNRASIGHHYPGEVPLSISAHLAIEQGKVPPESQQDLLELVARQQLFAVQHRLLEDDKQTASTILASISYTKQFRRHWLWWRFWSIMPLEVFLVSRRIIDWMRSGI